MKTTKTTTTKINRRGINAAVNAAIAKNPNANPAEMDKALKEVAERYGMTLKELNNWLADRL